MRGVWLVAGSIGALVVSYAADRWLWEILMQIGAYGRAEGWLELGLAVSLAFRLVLLAGMAVILVSARPGAPRWAAWTLIGIGIAFGIAPPLTMGAHVALAPGGLPFVSLTRETAPLWDGRGVFLLWTAVGLLVIGVATLPEARRVTIPPSIPPLVLTVGAGLLFAVSYPVDALFGALAIELATGLDAYPAYMLVALGMRIGVMVAIVVLLASVLHRRPSRIGAAALLVVGIVGFAVLPLIVLQQPTFALDPGSAGRWVAGATLVAGTIELLRRRTETSARVEIGHRPSEVSAA